MVVAPNFHQPLQHTRRVFEQLMSPQTSAIRPRPSPRDTRSTSDFLRNFFCEIILSSQSGDFS